MRIIEKSLCVMLFGLLTVMSIQGCSWDSNADRKRNEPNNDVYVIPKAEHRKTNLKTHESKEVSEINKKIDFQRKHIKGLEEFRTKQMHIGVMNDVDNWRTNGYVKLDGHPTHEDLASRAYTQAAAAETEIKIQKRKLDDLEHKKRELIKQSSGCFLPETLVKMEDGSLKPFVNLQPGQRVLTYDIGYDKLVNKQVIEVYSVKANHLYTINGQLTTTGGERLLTKNGWKKIRNLKQGDFVHLGGSMVKIESIDYVRINRTLYNMQVADTHNFYVVTTDGSCYLVHNSSGCSGSGSK